MSTKEEINHTEMVNLSSNLTIHQIVAERLSRRDWFRKGAGLSALAAFGGSLSACGGGGSTTGAIGERLDAVIEIPEPSLSFAAVAKNLDDIVTVPDGYQVSILHALGDRLTDTIPAWVGDGSETPESYQNRIGDGHDGMYFFGLNDQGQFDPTVSARGLLCVNHEYVTAPYSLHPVVRKQNGQARDKGEVDKEILAHGVSIVEVRRTAQSNDMQIVLNSKFNRRITSSTVMNITGPAAGHGTLITAYDSTARKTLGTNNNCACGHTPWGTYLTCEENYVNAFYRGDDTVLRADSSKEEYEGSDNYNVALRRYNKPPTSERHKRYSWDTVSTSSDYARWNMTQQPNLPASQDYRNIMNNFGWVVEIDPFAPETSPEKAPAKRTALGRMSHEGAWIAPAVAGQPIVVYMGDDAAGEYIYKYVSDKLWDPADRQGGLAAGSTYLDSGRLYVARFDASGQGQWMELTLNDPAIKNYAGFKFLYPGDVFINARIAGDALGATKMDRPEWAAVNPRNGEVYLNLTNNDKRTKENADAANPRSYEQIKLKPNPDSTTGFDEETLTGNVNGHIIRWKENGQQSATTFTWDIYLFGSPAAAPNSVNLSQLSGDNDFSSPDGLYFDSRGVLWIQTDDGAYTGTTNCMMLAGVPGKVGDGASTVVQDTEVTTNVGRAATQDNLRRFLVGPKSCEITGVVVTPDGKTMFCNVQHPGESGTLDNPVSSWPDSQINPETNSQTDIKLRPRPRSATVVITRKDGGLIAI